MGRQPVFPLYEARVVKGLSGGMDLAFVIVCLAERGAKGL
jgi:hypothetical protein